MSLYSINGNQISTVPPARADFYESILGRISEENLRNIIEEINRLIDERIAANDENILVAGWMPGNDWSDTPFEPIYEACRLNIEASGWMFGLLVWQAMIDRSEDWVFTKTQDIQSMVYFQFDRNR